MSPRDIRYPVGPFTFAPPVTAAQRAKWIEEIAHLPERVRAAVDGLSDEQLDAPYRPGGWTVRQVVHHLPDSHLNAYVRMKLAITEDTPAIKPYDQDRWSALDDARTAPIAASLALLDGLHARWAAMLRSLDDAAWRRSYFHPELQRAVPLEEVLAQYAWHGRHHTGHITGLREREDW